ncbi:quinone-dependent dihydroorotate dehydrogenase, partial [Kocuria sp.]|uniref:quinone-dependent dihydroorotate dehydrogenase n=1 Tax=Kocuria sp. TaxID=1871328 RepID=UPI0026DEC3DC
RLFRLIKDRAVINRMGFNNDGAAAVAPRVAATLQSLEEQALKTGLERPIVGVNIGKTKMVDLERAVGDYVTSTRALAPYADYLVVNVSSPNTPGLRQLQELDSLRPLLGAVREEADAVTGRHVPLLVKIAPDLADEDVRAVTQLALDVGLEGIVATNTTIAREGLGLRSTEDEVTACGAGGLSGLPVRRRSLEVLKMLRQHAGERLTLISVGGVTTPEDVIERLDAGADLVQGYTAFLYEGPFWAARINRGLKKAARRVRG